MRIEIVPEINRVLRRDEHGAKFGDLGMFLLKCFAPFFCQASVFIIRAQFALVPELSPVTQPMNGYGRSCSLHQLLNQLVPVQLRWKLPSKPLSTSSPTNVWQVPRTSVQNASHCRKRPLLRLCREELPDRRVRFVHRRELIPSLPSASR